MSSKHVPLRSLVVACVIMAFFCHDAAANTASPMTASSFGVEGGWFSARREGFRDLFGSGFTAGVFVQHSLSGNWQWGIRAYGMIAGEKVAKNSYADSRISTTYYSGGPRYKSVALVPLLVRSLTPDKRLSLTAGTGLGISYRQVITAVGESADPPIGMRVSQESVSPVWLIMLGADYNGWLLIRPGLRLYYDHHFTGDPTKGNFGDTGGFHLAASIALNL